MKSTRSLPGASNVKLVVQSQRNPHTAVGQTQKSNELPREGMCLKEINNALIMNIQNKSKHCSYQVGYSCGEIIPAKTVTGTKRKHRITAQGVFILLLRKTPAIWF